MQSDANFDRLADQIGTILETLIHDYRFAVPIGVIIEGANSSKIVGTYRPARDGIGLALEVEFQKIRDGGFTFPIDIEFRDSATNRAAGLTIEREEKLFSPRLPDCLN